MSLLGWAMVFCGAAYGGDAAVESELVRDNPDVVRANPRGASIFALQWRAPVVRVGLYRGVTESFGQPAISAHQHVVVVGTGEGEVVALSLIDGSEIWRFRHGAPFETAASVVQMAPGQEAVVLGARDGMLLALDISTGRLRWKTNIEGDMRAEPRVSGERLILTTAANRVMALNLHTGTVIWAQGRPISAALSVEGHARAVIEGDQVFATFSDGYVSAMDLEHGSVLWSRPLSLKGGGFIDADGDPFVADGRLFVSSYSDGVYALNPVDGQTLWNKPAPAITSLARQGAQVIAGSADGWVWGLRQEDGAATFRTRVAQGPISRMAVRDGLIAFTAGPSGLVVLKGATGEPVQATALGGRAAGDPAWQDTSLAFLTSSGYIFTWAYLEHGHAH